MKNGIGFSSHQANYNNNKYHYSMTDNSKIYTVHSVNLSTGHHNIGIKVKVVERQLKMIVELTLNLLPTIRYEFLKIVNFYHYR